MISKKTSLGLLIGSLFLIVAIGLFIGPFAQPEEYHNFVDNRSWLHLANVWNVLSNIPFALAGIWGLFLLFSHGKVTFVDDRVRWLWIGVSIGLVLTAIGSGYYHQRPDNARLVWDRLPMTLIFMSYLSALIGERINMRLGLWLWPILLGVGFFSVWYWQASELRGVGDLRVYLGVLIYTILATCVMLLTPSPYDKNWVLALVAICFGLAIVFEVFDHQIFKLSGNVISGHTLKHLAAGAAGLLLIGMIRTRKKEGLT